MIEEVLLKEIEPFVKACDKMIASKFIMIDKRISDVLKSIAQTDRVFDAIKQCMINFNFDKEYKAATAKSGYLVAPAEPHAFIAFAFSLLNYLDDKKISASELLTKYYSKSENEAGPYSEFCNSIIVRFKDLLVAKILNKSVEVKVNKAKNEVLINKDVLSRLAFLTKDLKDYVQGLKKLRKSKLTKGELLEIINQTLVSIKNCDANYLKAFILAIKAGSGKDKEIDRRLVELTEIADKTIIEK